MFYWPTDNGMESARMDQSSEREKKQIARALQQDVQRLYVQLCNQDLPSLSFPLAKTVRERG